MSLGVLTLLCNFLQLVRTEIMQVILLTTALALAACFTCGADVVIYKNKIAYTATGDGGMSRGTVAGWTLYDPGTAKSFICLPTREPERFSRKWRITVFSTCQGEDRNCS